MRCRVPFVAVVLVGLSFTAVLRAETVEDVEKKIDALFAKYKTLQFKNEFKTDITSETYSSKSSGESLIAFKRDGDNGYMSRIESKSKSVLKMQDQPEQESETELLAINDGDVMYSYSETGDTKTAMKKKIDSKTDINPFKPTSLFKQQREHFDLKLLPDEKLDGKATWVIESTPKADGNLKDAGKSRAWYEQKTGVVIKAIGYDKEGKEISSSKTSDIKIDSDIADDRFVFKAPEGVEVMDMDALSQGQPQSNDSSASADAEEKEEAPAKAKKDEPEAEEEEKPAEKKKSRNPLKNLFGN